MSYTITKVDPYPPGVLVTAQDDYNIESTAEIASVPEGLEGDELNRFYLSHFASEAAPANVAPNFFDGASAIEAPAAAPRRRDAKKQTKPNAAKPVSTKAKR